MTELLPTHRREANVDEDEFEEEVRTIARALWPSARSDGMLNIDKVEHDAIFFDHDVVHCVESTVSRRLDKATHDGDKLHKAIRRWTGSDGRIAKGWFVTLNAPTPDQSKEIRRIDPRITALSFAQFKTRLFDSVMYLQRRREVPFGSARNPEDPLGPLEPYVPLDIYPADADSTTNSAPMRVGDLGELLLDRVRFALTGDYGAGKSMTFRQLFFWLAEANKDGRTLRFPVHLNLRDHWGQKTPRVALTQHAEDIGFDRPESLVAAWRAGYVHVLLDGFDEIAAPGWSGDVKLLRETRMRAMELIRRFFKETPKRASVAVAGRRHFFDGESELRDAMFDERSRPILQVSEFNEEQIREYLGRKKWYALPQWLPARPLLIGHLAARRALESLAEAGDLPPAEGWEALLDAISNREADIEAGIDGESVRRTLERLASLARCKSNGLGPLTYSEITDSFTYIRGQEPSDDQRTILHRLPGLGVDADAEQGTRYFIDADLAAAAQAKDVSQFVLNPFPAGDSLAPKWQTSLAQLGIEVAAAQCSGFATEGSMAAAVATAAKNDLDVLSADIVRVGMTLGYHLKSRVNVDGVHVPLLELFEGHPDMSGLTFSNCVFELLEISGEIHAELVPSFSECYFDTVLGRAGVSDLPHPNFSDTCTYGSFPDSLDRNASVVASDLPTGVRVTIILLRKLFMQRGRGRAESALVRGMPQAERSLVPAALSALEKEGLATKVKINSRPVWLPERSSQKRVRAFVAAPRTTVLNLVFVGILVAGRRGVGSG
jgi:NACHT domain.